MRLEKDKRYKIKTNSIEICKKVQKELFKQGCRWPMLDADTEPIHLDVYALFVNCGTITGTYGKHIFENKCNHEEISYKDLIYSESPITAFKRKIFLEGLKVEK